MKNVGKIPTLHAGISERGVTVELDDSAVDLILREGYSPEYGARDLERVMIVCCVGRLRRRSWVGKRLASA